MSKQGTTMAKYFGGRTYEDLARAFSRLDADGDSYLTWDEFVEGASHYQRTTGSAPAPAAAPAAALAEP